MTTVTVRLDNRPAHLLKCPEEFASPQSRAFPFSGRVSDLVKPRDTSTGHFMDGIFEWTGEE
jgi:hypothetical protein